MREEPGRTTRRRDAKAGWATTSAIQSHERILARARGVQSVLVVGGAGYIGSVVCRRLLDAGYSVKILDAFLYGADSLLSIKSHPAITVIRGDTRDGDVVSRALEGVDAVIHLGELVGDPACNLDPTTTVLVNVVGTRMLAEAARDSGVRLFLYPSSCSVYGATGDDVDEGSTLNPVSLYARAKIAAERTLLDMQDLSFHPVIFRLATVFGPSPRPRFDLVVNLFTARAVRDGHIHVEGGAQWRPFVHVDDVATAMLLALQQPVEVLSGQIVNLGSNDQNYTIAEVAQLVAAAVPGATTYVSESSDPRDYRVRFDRLSSLLGFRPSRTVYSGITQLRDALKSGEIADYQDPRYSNVRALQETDARHRIALTSSIPVSDRDWTAVDLPGPGVGEPVRLAWTAPEI